MFLQVDEDSIAERVGKATEHRDSKWAEYIRTKGKSVEEIAQYYIEQQKSQLQLLRQSAVPHIIFDTTTHNYAQVKGEIINLLNG